MEIDELLGFAKRTGFFWPAAEIYGGVSGIFDYGHLGTVMKRRFEDLWLKFFVERNENYYFIDGSTMLPEKPLIASGHASRFNDVIVGCKKCKTYYRADVLLNELGVKVSEGATVEELETAIKNSNTKCPKCGGELMEPKAFNMMIDVQLGPEKHEKGFLRPETAQSTYLNFFREFNILRKRLPLGLAIIGRAYRNEISPRQGLYRMRELLQAELQIFFDPDNWNIEDERFLEREINVVLYRDKQQRTLKCIELVTDYEIPKFYAYHLGVIDYFYRELLSIPKERLRFLELGGNEKAFYNRVHFDIEADIKSWNGFKEIGGLHYRGDYDLSSHSKGANQDLSVNIDGKKFIPHVLELSFGVDRNMWMLLDVFYDNAERDLLKLPLAIAPYDAAIFPLQNDEKLTSYAKSLYKKLKENSRVSYDESGSIGRRYARMDEIGTPFCITVDYETIEQGNEKYGTVTIRNRDTKLQERVKDSDIKDMLERTDRSVP